MPDIALSKVHQILADGLPPMPDADYKLLTQWTAETVLGWQDAQRMKGKHGMVASLFALFNAIYALGIQHGRTLGPVLTFTVAPEDTEE